MKNIISGLGLVSLLACGGVKSVKTVGVSSSADAAKLSGRTVSNMQAVNGSASRDFSLGSVNVTCATRGSVNIAVGIGTDTSGSETTGSIDYTFTAKDCVKANDYEIDGSATYTWGFNSTDSNNLSLTIGLNGTLAVVDYNSDGSVDQSADVTYDNVKVTYTSTTTTVNNTTCYSVSAKGSGSIKVGNQTYTPSADEWAGAWGDTSLGASYSACVTN